MSEEIKDVNAKIDEAEAAVKKYASKDTVISIGGYEFTPAKLMVAFTLASSLLGGLYGAFEVYKDYQGMKKRIAEYVAPDLTVFDKRLAVIEETSGKTADYTRDIKNDLKSDIRRVEGVVESVERGSKQAQRENENEIKSLRVDVRTNLDKSRDEMDKTKQVIDGKMDKLSREMDSKIKQALDNPLSK
jgi:hypothetical protein